MSILVQILRYNCSETDYSFCEDSPPSRTRPSTQMWVSPLDSFSPPLFFSLRCPCHSATSSLLHVDANHANTHYLNGHSAAEPELPIVYLISFLHLFRKTAFGYGTVFSWARCTIRALKELTILTQIEKITH